MADFINTSASTLIISGKEFAPDATLPVSDEMKENPAIAGWIKEKMITPKGKSK